MSNPKDHNEVACAIRDGFSRLSSAIETIAGNENAKLILNRIIQMEGNIMSAISDFVTKQTAFNTRQGAAIDSAVAGVGGLTDDVKALNDKITELQNSQGTITPQDQELLNQLEEQGESISARLETLSSALQALDEKTPPVVPPGT